MSNVWLEGIQNPGLPQLPSKAVSPVNFGSDLSCTTDLTDDFAETDPNSVEGLSEFAIRAITTTKGSLPDKLDQGIDIRAWINKGATKADLLAYGGQVRGELERDDRVELAKCVVTYDPVLKLLRFAITLTPIDPRIAPFDLIITLNSDGVVTVLK